MKYKDSMSILFGADPELALQNAKGEAIGAWTVTKGVKDQHEPWPGPVEGMNVHADGVALEFNFKPVNRTEFRKVVSAALRSVSDYVNKSGIQCYQLPEIENFSAETLMHPLTNTIGCDPDFCAYDENPDNPRTCDFNPLATKKRFFGGHIHVGYDKEMIPPWALVRVIEVLNYLPFLNKDDQKDRRKYYGLGGLFRPKSYGVEYRTPSNFWLQDRTFMDCFTSNVCNFMDFLAAKPKVINKWFNAQPWQDVKACVDKVDLLSSKKLHRSFTASLNGLGLQTYGQPEW